LLGREGIEGRRRGMLSLMTPLFQNPHIPKESSNQNRQPHNRHHSNKSPHLSVLITTFLGNVWVLKEGGHEVVNCSYLWGLIFGDQALYTISLNSQLNIPRLLPSIPSLPNNVPPKYLYIVQYNDIKQCQP
jgi:hypothetical protein